MARSARNPTTRVAIVTGGGTGLGRDMANRLAADGFEVAILGRRARRLKPKKDERNLHPHVCDVADRAQIRATVKAVRARFGRIWVCVERPDRVAGNDVCIHSYCGGGNMV